MLVLGAKPGDRIHLHTPAGECIVVTFLGKRQQDWRLGFEAPSDIHIVRERVLRRREREEAA